MPGLLIINPIGQTEMSGSVSVALASDNGIKTFPMLMAENVISGSAEHRFGYVATNNTTITAVRSTIYTEPVVGNNLEVLSANANDTLAGTGTRTLRVTYYRNDGTGPFDTTINMNGTTAVPIGDSTARFVEKMTTVTVGSVGGNVGIITIRLNGGGATVGTIPAGDSITNWAHHYVADGKKCMFSGVYGGCTGNNARLLLRFATPLTVNTPTLPFGQNYRIQNNASSLIDRMDVPIKIIGFARVELTVRSDSNTANTIFAGFNFYEV